MKLLLFILALSFALASCNNGESTSPDMSTAESAAADEISETEEKMGTFTFAIEEEKNVFGHLPAEKNMANSFSTMLLAKPEAGSSEEFSIVVMNFNVKTEDLPATLELDLKEAMEDPAAAATAPKAIVQYVSADGIQYRAYAAVTFESYTDGVVKGVIADTELPTIKPEDNDKPPVLLTDASFEVGL